MAGGSTQDTAAVVLTILRLWERRVARGVIVMTALVMEARVNLMMTVDLVMADARQTMSDGGGKEDQRNECMNGEGCPHHLYKASSS